MSFIYHKFSENYYTLLAIFRPKIVQWGAYNFSLGIETHEIIKGSLKNQGATSLTGHTIVISSTTNTKKGNFK